jgi:hypothetical protein
MEFFLPQATMSSRRVRRRLCRTASSTESRVALVRDHFMKMPQKLFDRITGFTGLIISLD